MARSVSWLIGSVVRIREGLLRLSPMRPNPSVNADAPPAWRVMRLSRHAVTRGAGYLHR